MKGKIVDSGVKVDAAQAAARSAMYQILSRLFFYPAEMAALPLAEVAAELRRRLEALPGDQSEFAGLMGEVDAVASMPEPALRGVFTALFDNCRGRAAVSLYEKDYGNGEAKAVWEEVVRFYEHFGLSFDVRVSRDWPDHIGTELEFMHYLTYVEAVAEQDVGIYRQAQGDFLARHLARWAPRFAAQLSGGQEAGPYGIFARLVAAFIKAEMAYLGRTCESGAPWIPQREAQAGLQGKAWIPIVEASALETFDY